MADQNTAPKTEAKKRWPLWARILFFPLTIIGWLAQKLFKKGTNITKALAEIPLQIGLHGLGIMVLVCFMYNPLYQMFTDASWANSSSLFAYVRSNVLALNSEASFGTNFDLLVSSFGWGFLALTLVAVGASAYVLQAARESFSIFGALIFIGILVGSVMALNTALPQYQLLTGVLLHWIVMAGASLFFGLGMCTSKLNKRLKGVISNDTVDNDNDNEE